MPTVNEDINDDRACCNQCKDCANVVRLPFGVCPFHDAMTEALKSIVAIMDDTQVVDRKTKLVNVSLSINKGGWKCRYYERAKNPAQLLLPAPGDNPHKERKLKFKLSKPLVMK